MLSYISELQPVLFYVPKDIHWAFASPKLTYPANNSIIIYYTKIDPNHVYHAIREFSSTFWGQKKEYKPYSLILEYKN
jgi:hypothetical protein